MAGQLRLQSLKRVGTFVGKRVIGILCTIVSILFLLSIVYDGNDTNLNDTNLNDTALHVEARHVAFLKVHKTGSSSVQNIFIRFGDSRNLTFLLGSAKGNECNGWPNCISFYKTLHPGNIVPPPRNTSYDILCSHVIYNREAFRKYLPRDTRYIGLVREPTKRLESAIAFFRLFKGVSLTQFAQNATKYQHHWANNVMAFEFGFRPEWFPNVTHNTLQEQERVAVNEYIDQVMDEFDLILINEMLDESLVLMRRLLGWSITDILYQRKLTRIHSQFLEKDIPNVKKYLYLDYMLYERATKALISKISESGNDFTGEVKAFQVVNSKVNRYCECTSCMRTPLILNATQWHSASNVTQDTCKTLRIYEAPYLHAMRVKQVGLEKIISEIGDVSMGYASRIGFGTLRKSFGPKHNV